MCNLHGEEVTMCNLHGEEVTMCNLHGEEVTMCIFHNIYTVIISGRIFSKYYGGNIQMGRTRRT
jgi:hypothetical protein